MAKKNKFDDLNEDWKKHVEGLSDLESLKTEVATVAKQEFLNQSTMKADQDLNEKKDAVKVASSGYREVTKTNKLKLAYLTQLAADKGDAVAQETIQRLIDAENQKG
jgi:hypothetical protein